MYISPLQIWKGGEQLTATKFNLRIVADNLSDHATFYYSLQSDSDSLVSEGNLTISGEDYQDWGTSQDINIGAYNWAANKLSLTIVPEPTPEPVQPEQ